MAVPREALVTPREDLSLLGFLCRLWTLDGGPFPGPWPLLHYNACLLLRLGTRAGDVKMFSLKAASRF